MSKFEIVMPKLGESVQQATITKWFIKEGDTIEEEDTLLEIATDKVDSEIPSPVDGKVQKILYEEGALVTVGEVIAIVNMDGDEAEEDTKTGKKDTDKTSEKSQHKKEDISSNKEIAKKGTRFYSPLVRNIAKQENITLAELESIQGSGTNGRVRKEDVLAFLEKRKKGGGTAAQSQTTSSAERPKVSVSANAGDEIVEMDRMRRMIADNMVLSKQTAPHVTSMVEADVTNIVEWRNKMKDTIQKREGFKLSYLPVFIDAAARALREFPQVNSSVDGHKIILRKDVNIGIAVALPDGNLIVPVIRHVDQRNLLGINLEMDRLVKAARNNKLSPDDVAGGTFSITNFGSFRNVMGTPIINQPQVAIMATGTIEKKPAVLETPSGDVIAIRSKMFLSLSYDHRVVDGALGGAFIRKVADHLEAFDSNQKI